MQPGQLLNQDDLAKRFGVSRIPLREALCTLAGEGLVIMRPGIGAVVTELNADEINELYGLRLQLEPPLAEWIVARRHEQDLMELEGILARMSASRPDDVAAWANYHYLFHRRMIELSGRRHSLRLINQVLNLVEPYSRLYVHLVGPDQHSVAKHEEIIALLRAGDAQGLSARMTRGLSVVREQLATSLHGEDRQVDLAVLLGAIDQET